MTVGESMQAAYRAGQASGDTGQFRGWLESKGLSGHSATLRSRLQREYERGVSGGVDRSKADDLNRQFLERQKTGKSAKVATFKGSKILELADGSWVIPSIDRESHFDSLKDAKAFLSDWKRNPVTDRAHRYRAQKIAAGPKVCALCGSRKNVVPDHKDGHPDHTTKSNLQWLCKSCNTAKGFWMRDHGKGRLTHQYNPAEGVPTYKQYAFAVATHSPGAHDEGGAIIHATPKKLRSEYARMIADTKRSRGRMADDERWNPASAFRRPPNLRAASGSQRCGTCGFFDNDKCQMFGGYPVASAQVCDDYVKGVPGSMRNPDVNESVQDRSWREWGENFARVSAKPEAASDKDLRRAIGYLDHARRSLIRRAQEAGGKVDPNVLAGYDNEYEYYVSLVRKREAAKGRNPAKFDRCLKAVQARGGDVNAYAVCTAAGTRNPAKLFIRRRGELYEVVDALGTLHYQTDTRGDAEKVTRKMRARLRDIRKRNPESSAASLYESFHGTPSTQTLEVEEEHHEHEHLALLGRLVEIWALTLTGMLVHIEFDETDPVWCSSSEDGRQLYFVGGDQSVDLAAFKMAGEEWIKDRMVIGQFAAPMCGKCGTEFTKRGQTFTCPKCGHKATYDKHSDKDVVYNLGYHTKKEFDKFAPIDYQHDLGEETGVRPMLEYDPRSKHLYVTGGQYRIEQPLLGTSPGIEN